MPTVPSIENAVKRGEKMSSNEYAKRVEARLQRAKTIAEHGGLDEALAAGALSSKADLTLSEALVLGLLRQGVRRYLGVFGHGSTEIAEVLRVYEQEKLVRTYAVRNEIEASHAASALRWVTGEKAAVFTSIGPGMLHALAGSLVPASDGLGVWYLVGDETTEDEGPNMQQIPSERQGSFLDLCQIMGRAYCLHTPWSVSSALRKGLNAVDHPYRAGPFFLLLPMNTQCEPLPSFNLEELPVGAPPSLGAAGSGYDEALEAIRNSSRIVVKVGGGARSACEPLARFLDLADAVAVTSPLVSGVLPYGHPRNMTVGGSKGSISGNYAMEEADCLVAIGTRFVCQSDCSRTGYPKVERVICINANIEDATHYNKTVAMAGDAASTLRSLNKRLLESNSQRAADPSAWLRACQDKKREWEAFKAERYAAPLLYDEVWGREVLTQPAAIKTASDWARDKGAVAFYDAGDVQANGFQIVEDDRLGLTFTDTGASYMGFAVSALLSTALASNPFYGIAFTGDGSFVMNPQILIDGVEHGARGCILLLDNRRMGAITGLQFAQYDQEYATGDSVNVDYADWANSVRGVLGLGCGGSTQELLEALDKAYAHDGLSLVHVPVYFGQDPLGGMGVFGRWNVGNWCQDVQSLRHRIGL